MAYYKIKCKPCNVETERKLIIRIRVYERLKKYKDDELIFGKDVNDKAYENENLIEKFKILRTGNIKIKKIK